MDARKLLALYRLKWNPFLEDIPVEALCETPRINHLAWRIEDLVAHGGFALITGDVGAGKSAAMRMLASKLSPLSDVVVGEVTRPQSRVTDFYREIRDLFGVPVSTSNRWGAYKAVRAKWQEHIQQTRRGAASSRVENVIRPVALPSTEPAVIALVVNAPEIASAVESSATAAPTWMSPGSRRVNPIAPSPDSS